MIICTYEKKIIKIHAWILLKNTFANIQVYIIPAAVHPWFAPNSI